MPRWLQALRFLRENYKIYRVSQWLFNSVREVSNTFSKNPKMNLQEAQLLHYADFILFDPYCAYSSWIPVLDLNHFASHFNILSSALILVLTSSLRFPDSKPFLYKTKTTCASKHRAVFLSISRGETSTPVLTACVLLKFPCLFYLPTSASLTHLPLPVLAWYYPPKPKQQFTRLLFTLSGHNAAGMSRQTSI